eukprot:TRINITY_DN5748_c0_g1_i1.p1 TRINITY_DN5748_c0_g1~~TRINITY_DN5748_c0_g1_i1.p1  ORF type:complete len:758 (+),score=81.91 TRINITY_DN5748_c0_g1_i1:62-2335(+)
MERSGVRRLSHIDVGDEIDVFSRQSQRWFAGEVDAILEDDYIRVKYSDGQKLYQKTMHIESEGVNFPELASRCRSVIGSPLSSCARRKEERVEDARDVHGDSSSEEEPCFYDPLSDSCKVQRSEVARDSRISYVPEYSAMKSHFYFNYKKGSTLFDSAEYKTRKTATKVFLYEHRPSGVFVWHHLLDLSQEGVRSKLLFHYTNGESFYQITDMRKPAIEIFASLRNAYRPVELQQNTRFGEGVYASQYDPQEWGSKERILLNNFCSITAHQGKADYCIPLLVPVDWAWTCDKHEAGSHIGWNIHDHFYAHVFTDRSDSTMFTDRSGLTCKCWRTPSPFNDVKKYGIDPFYRDVWRVVVQNEHGAVEGAKVNYDRIQEILRARYERNSVVNGSNHFMTKKAAMDVKTCDNMQQGTYKTPIEKVAHFIKKHLHNLERYETNIILLEHAHKRGAGTATKLFQPWRSTAAGVVVDVTIFGQIFEGPPRSNWKLAREAAAEMVVKALASADDEYLAAFCDAAPTGRGPTGPDDSISLLQKKVQQELKLHTNDGEELPLHYGLATWADGGYSVVVKVFDQSFQGPPCENARLAKMAAAKVALFHCFNHQDDAVNDTAATERSFVADKNSRMKLKELADCMKVPYDISAEKTEEGFVGVANIGGQVFYGEPCRSKPEAREAAAKIALHREFQIRASDTCVNHQDTSIKDTAATERSLVAKKNARMRLKELADRMKVPHDTSAEETEAETSAWRVRAPSASSRPR